MLDLLRLFGWLALLGVAYLLAGRLLAATSARVAAIR